MTAISFLEASLLAVFLTVSVFISVRDVKTKLIRNKTLFIAATLLSPFLLVLIFSGEEPLSQFRDVFVGAAISFTVYMVLAVLAPGQIGGGDLKLSPLIGAIVCYFAGLTGVALWLAGTFLLGGLLSAVLLLGRFRKDGDVPFAPIMFAAAWGIIFIGLEWVR